MLRNSSLLGRRKEGRKRELRVPQGSGEVSIKLDVVLLIGTNKLARMKNTQGISFCSPLDLQLLTCFVLPLLLTRLFIAGVGHSDHHSAWHLTRAQYLLVSWLVQCSVLPSTGQATRDLLSVCGYEPPKGLCECSHSVRYPCFWTVTASKWPCKVR